MSLTYWPYILLFLCFSKHLNDLLQLAYNGLFLCLLTISSHFACLNFLRHFRVSLLPALCSASNLLLLFGPLLTLRFIHAAASRSPLLSQFTASSTEQLNKSLACVMTFWNISPLTVSTKVDFLSSSHTSFSTNSCSLLLG